MILFTTNGLELRVFDTGREIATKTLSPAEAARLTSDLLDGLHDHLTPEALRVAQEGEPDISRRSDSASPRCRPQAAHIEQGVKGCG